MAFRTFYITAPAVATVFGIYLFDKHQYHSSTKPVPSQDKGEGLNQALRADELAGGTPSSSSFIANTASAAKLSRNEMAKLAPQFDGLNCFESLVSC